MIAIALLICGAIIFEMAMRHLIQSYTKKKKD